MNSSNNGFGEDGGGCTSGSMLGSRDGDEVWGRVSRSMSGSGDGYEG